jgi:murein DD-endopeptidase MepM/ murein hydrolase activator NlpD
MNALRFLLIWFLFFINSYTNEHAILFAGVKEVFHEARIQYNQKRYHQALKLFIQCTELDPRARSCWTHAAKTLDHLKKHKKAITYYQEAIKLKPRDHEVHIQMGFIYHLKLNNYDKALKSYLEAIRLMELKNVRIPAWLYYNTGLTATFTREQNLKNAEQYFRKAIAHAEIKEEKYQEAALSKLNSILSKQGKLQKQSEHYRGYLTIFPLGGIDGIDYYRGLGFDNNPVSNLPLTIPIDMANKIINSKIPEDKLKLFVKYYRPAGNYYRLIALENQVPLVTVWIASILRDWGQADRSLFRTDTMLDYMGLTRTYDNHIGHDFLLLTYEFQDYGVPVYAAANGKVKIVRKGSPAREVKAGEKRGENTVYLDHGHGRVTYYNHLRQDVLVNKNDPVYAGQHIAWVGAASGGTSGQAPVVGSTPPPHLHFSVIEWDKWLEPYQGPANKETSRWRDQPPYRQKLKLMDFGIVPIKMMNHRPLPTPRNTYYRLKSKDICLWFYYYYLESGVFLTYKIVSTEGEVVFSNRVRLPESYGRQDTIDLNSIPLRKGTWIVQIDKNSKKWFQFTFDVVDENESPPKNRAPKPPVNPKMIKISADTHYVYKSSVDFPSVYIDPDLDRMRYRYQWKLNGKMIRDITMASHFDYFPAYMAEKGASIECTIYAFDGTEYSKPVVLKGKLDI